MYYEIKNNRIILSGIIPGHVRLISSALHNAIHKFGYKDIEIDLSDVRQIDPSFSIVLANAICKHKSAGIDFEIIPPLDVKLKRLLINSNLLHIIDSSNFAASRAKITYNLPLSHFVDHDQQYLIVNDAMERIIQCISGLKRYQMSALEWSLNEITENVLSHSESPTGGFVQIVSFPSRGFVGLYVADNGIGIPISMRKTHPNLHNDSQTIDRAIREGVTSKKGAHQGNGLFGTFECCKIGKGEMEIHSGNASGIYKRGALSVRSEPTPFKGTFIKALINYQTEHLLTKALVFRGKKHTPNDYLDITYQESDGDRVLFPMSSATTGFGTRSSGVKIRNIIRILTDEFQVGVTLDFSNTPVVSASFADELFGRFTQEFGAKIYTTSIKFLNVDPENKLIINRAISLRSNEGDEVE